MRTFSIVTAVVTALIILIVGYGALTTNVGSAGTVGDVGTGVQPV